MKRFFSLLALLMMIVMTGGYVHAQETREWNFSDAKWKTVGTLSGSDTKYSVTFAEQKECDGLTIYGTSDKKIVIDNNTKTVDGVKYTYRLKLGGDGLFNTDNTPKQCVISLNVKNKTSFYVVLANANKSEARSLKFDALVDGQRTNFGEIQLTGNEYKSATVEYKEAKEATIFIYGVGGVNLYDIKVKTEASEVPATTTDITIGNAKMATYCNSSAWEIPAGMEVYTATYADNKVKLNKVTETVVPANTGVVLYGEPKTYTANLTTSEATLTEANELRAATTDVTIAENDNKYILVYDNANKIVKFGKASAGTLAAGKAYLEINNANAAKQLSIDFNGETTGINTVENATEAQNDVYYTLGGQRTVKPVKGLYIHNGKKYIAK